jgi:hypothetical protein
MALLLQKMGRFMKKRCYGAKKRRDYMKAKEMICYNCKSLNHVVAECPYEDKRFNDGELKLKKNKKDKKEKKVRRNFTINKKKGGDFVVTWDSDVSDESDDDGIASIAISNKPSLFNTTSTCLMAKPTKVQYDDSNDNFCASDGCRSDDDDEEDYSKDDLMNIIDQMSKGYKKLSKKSKMLEQKLNEKSNENKELVDELDALKKSKEYKGLE